MRFKDAGRRVHYFIAYPYLYIIISTYVCIGGRVCTRNPVYDIDYVYNTNENGKKKYRFFYAFTFFSHNIILYRHIILLAGDGLYVNIG